MTTLDEAKGVVDKNVGKPEKESKSGFKVGQRVAHYRGMGKTLHGNVTSADAQSGGKKGAMVKFEHGTEFVPHSELKDAGQYWKDEQDSMYKRRVKEDVEEIEEISKHSFVGKILRGHELRKKVASTWKDAVDSSSRGDEQGANKAMNKHFKYANLEHPGTWTKVKEEIELEEGSSGTIIHKVTHEGKVKFITRYGKAADAVAAKLEKNTGKPCKITQHISDKNGFYRLHKEEVENMVEEDDWEAEEREEKRRRLAAAMASVDQVSKHMDYPTGRNYPAWQKRKEDAAKKAQESKGK